MPFGISPAPEIFQRWLEQQLIGLDGVSNIHDDILVIGEGNDLEELFSTTTNAWTSCYSGAQREILH